MGRVLVAVLLAWFVASPTVAANHVQNESGKVVVFDHKTGNEWWVEVILTGQDGGAVASVEAMDTNGPWTSLTKRSWGAWAASFHIEPGHPVRFRATWAGGAQVMSCWFTHPSGAEGCSSEPGAFDASFSDVKGNDWWVQARVFANQPLMGVDARVNCVGDWKPLTLRSWGSWAASFHVPSGSKVVLRARSTSGAQDLSGGYIWPQATPTGGCPGFVVPFTAHFQNVRGNLWWVETDVTGDNPIAAVEMRAEGGPWRGLTKQSWGSWAASTRVEPSALVQFRARDTMGAVDYSAGGWQWANEARFIEAHPAASSSFNAAFHHAAGNATAVQINIFATQRLSGADYRVDGGPWRAMLRSASGDWRADASPAVPKHADVEFRARSGSAADVSDGFVWPPFPQPGSYAEYRFRTKETRTDGSGFITWDGLARIEAVPGGWTTHCHALRSDYDATSDRWTNTTHLGPVGLGQILMGNPDTFVGAIEAGWMIENCHATGHQMEVTDRGPHRTSLRTISGDPITLDSWHAIEDFEPGTPPRWNIWWDARYGVVTNYSKRETTGGAAHTYELVGWLLDTNAPLT